MSVASESSLPPIPAASSNEGSLAMSGRQPGAPTSGRSGVLGDMYAIDRSRSPVSPQGTALNAKLTTYRDPNRASGAPSSAGDAAGAVMEVPTSPQDAVVRQLTSREWETSELAGPREHFPTASSALSGSAAPAQRPQRPQRTPRSSAVQRGSSRPGKISAARASMTRSPAAQSAVAASEEEALIPGQRPRRASLYHDVGPVPRTPRTGADSETSSAAAARRVRSASASKYKHVRSVVRDYVDNRITEEEARYSALRAVSPARQSIRRGGEGQDQEVSPEPPSQRTPRERTPAQRRSLLPPAQRSSTPGSARKVPRDFVPRCATMIPERFKYHPKPITATEECDPTTVDGIPYEEYREAQEAEQQRQAARDAALVRGSESSLFDPHSQPQNKSTSSRATSARRSRQGQPPSRARSTSAGAARRPQRADPLQVADEDFVVPVTVDSEALSREDPYAPPRRSVSNRRGRSRSPRAGSRGASRANTPRAQRVLSPQRTPRGSAVAGSRRSQASMQGVNPFAYRRKLVFAVAPPDLSASDELVPAS